jgi:hypothetical protein
MINFLQAMASLPKNKNRLDMTAAKMQALTSLFVSRR